MRTLRCSASFLFILAFLTPTLLRNAAAQHSEQKAELAVDSDHDGMSDALEQALLIQFAPTFLVNRNDCSEMPAEFAPNLKTPTVKAADGTIYGQVFPAKLSIADLPTAEIHFYHLWARDCGPHPHPLDAEHVAVLVTASDRNLDSAKWKAAYWYAAAHEDTVCDVSQITRASTLHAKENGARVFISSGKHASYLNEKLCQAGCGADKCVGMVALPPGRIINLGEASHPMNGSVFIASREWPLIEKMTNTNFPPEPLARLNKMPDTDIAWFNAGRHPAQGIIANSNATEQAIADGASHTTSSLAKAGSATGVAISVAQDDTGNALQKTYSQTKHALGTSAKHAGKALHPRQNPEKLK
ncbi:MAG TPA: hypothetical protein VGT08_08270 [Terracidiphilus sp.]|nr:hypothetical protein [Terracidiphilus sp.]